MTQSDDEKLDQLLSEIRDEPVAASDDLMARILTDARALQPTAPSISVSRQGIRKQILAMFGGWPALSGVAAAGVAGLWIGLIPPDSLDVWVADALGASTSVSLGEDFLVFGEGFVDG